MSYGRRKEKGDCGGNPIYHHGARRTPWNICIAILWGFITTCDL